MNLEQKKEKILELFKGEIPIDDILPYMADLINQWINFNLLFVI